MCFRVRMTACVPCSGADEECNSMEEECLHRAWVERLPQLLRVPMCCNCFATALEEGNIFLMKIPEELEGFLLWQCEITLVTNMVETRKEWMIHLANRGRQVERSGQEHRKELEDQVEYCMHGAVECVGQEMDLSVVPWRSLQSEGSACELEQLLCKKSAWVSLCEESRRWWLERALVRVEDPGG